MVLCTDQQLFILPEILIAPMTCLDRFGGCHAMSFSPTQCPCAFSICVCCLCAPYNLLLYTTTHTVEWNMCSFIKMHFIICIRVCIDYCIHLANILTLLCIGFIKRVFFTKRIIGKNWNNLFVNYGWMEREQILRTSHIICQINGYHPTGVSCFPRMGPELWDMAKVFLDEN